MATYILEEGTVQELRQTLFQIEVDIPESENYRIAFYGGQGVAKSVTVESETNPRFGTVTINCERY